MSLSINLKCAYAKTCLQSLKVFYGILAIDRKHVYKNPSTSIFDKSNKNTGNVYPDLYPFFLELFLSMKIGSQCSLLDARTKLRCFPHQPRHRGL